MESKYPELPSKPKTALQFPKMTCLELDQNRWEDVLPEWKDAKQSITFYRTQDNKIKCLFTDLDEELFIMLCEGINRHIEVCNFFKLALLDIEKGREIPCTDPYFTYKAIDYIKLKRTQSINLEIDKDELHGSSSRAA